MGAGSVGLADVLRDREMIECAPGQRANYVTVRLHGSLRARRDRTPEGPPGDDPTAVCSTMTSAAPQSESEPKCWNASRSPRRLQRCTGIGDPQCDWQG
jgi:hypothetical protein